MRTILHLNLKRKWFDMIKSGEKTEEYREIKPYWEKVFVFFKLGKPEESFIKIKGRWYRPSWVTICFSCGYNVNRDSFYIGIKDLSKGTGKSKWGAEPGKIYFKLKLGKTLDTNKT